MGDVVNKIKDDFLKNIDSYQSGFVNWNITQDIRFKNEFENAEDSIQTSFERLQGIIDFLKDQINFYSIQNQELQLENNILEDVDNDMINKHKEAKQIMRSIDGLESETNVVHKEQVKNFSIMIVFLVVFAISTGVLTKVLGNNK